MNDTVRRPPHSAEIVYVHAPFCARRCVYCDFAVSVRATGDLDGWLAALGAELEIARGEGLLDLADELRTLYVGGGTPTLLGPHAMDGLADLLGRSRLERPGLEWTAEANPESLTDDVAVAWRAAGVNRLSLGVQTFHEPALRWMGRLHGPEGAVDAVARARNAGITNLSVDLIFGLPRSVGRSWRADLDRVLSLDVPHVSLYGLSIEQGTPLGRALREGRARPVDEEQYGEEFLLASEVLGQAGYEQYEVSNFARPGFASVHNGAYWDGTPYLGLGNGAHSYAPPVRRWNTRAWEEYASAVATGRSPQAEREDLDDEARRLEAVWLALRTDRGIDAPSDDSPAQRVVHGWRERGLAVVHEGRVTLTPSGWLLLDELTVELDRARSG